MQQLPEEVILRFRARLCSNPTSPQFQSLRPYIWVKESGSGLRLIARQEVFCSDGTPSQDDRAFVIEVHTVEETIAIFEERASGGFGGCVFARAHVPSANHGEHIKPCDIYSGGTLAVAGRTFEVLEADAFTMKHVRAHPLQFPQRALSSVLRAIIDAQQLESIAYAFAQCDLTACGCVCLTPAVLSLQPPSRTMPPRSNRARSTSHSTSGPAILHYCLRCGILVSHSTRTPALRKRGQAASWCTTSGAARLHRRSAMPSHTSPRNPCRNKVIYPQSRGAAGAALATIWCLQPPLL